MLAFSLFVYYTITSLDMFIVIIPHDYENCEKLETSQAVEDLTIFGNIIIGGGDDRIASYSQNFAARQLKPGSLIAIDPVTKNTYTILIENFPDINFHPHGLYLYRNSSLYVLNHAYYNGGERIEIFDLFENENKVKAKYKKSITFDDSYLGRLNDLAVLNDEEIYITEWISEPCSPEGFDHST